MRGETMKDKSKKSTYSTTFGVDPTFLRVDCEFSVIDFLKPHSSISLPISIGDFNILRT